MAESCRLSGRIAQTLASGARFTVVLRQATLGADSGVMAGVGLVSDGSLFSVQGIRR